MLTDRDLEITETLTCRVRAMTTEQVAALWWHGNIEEARQRMKLLRDKGIIESTRTLFRPRNVDPAFAWCVSDAVPSFEELAQAAHGFEQQRTQTQLVYTTTAFNANIFASEFTQSPPPEEHSRHLRLADAYLSFRSSTRTEGSHWFNRFAGNREESGHGGPDVLIANDVGVAIRAIGSVSRSGQQLRALHAFCAEKGLPYDLW